MQKLFLVLGLITLVGCVDGNYNYPDSYGYPSSGYGNSGYGYGNSGYGNGGYYPPPPPRNNGYGNSCGGDKRCGGNDRSCGGDKRCGGDRQNNNVYAPPPPPPVHIDTPPSCPSGSVLDGRGCRVTDSSKRRPGGDGYINPCSGGKRYSGGRCI